ncbi:hypothetical protein LJC61_05265 [Ruminococcaceae bacterium OttesenSCG-928-A16]|nr:hypothetical protein [Ruminococcaceae bacterium OttesenSCG-928-A16]
MCADGFSIILDKAKQDGYWSSYFSSTLFSSLWDDYPRRYSIKGVTGDDNLFLHIKDDENDVDGLPFGNDDIMIIFESNSGDIAEYFTATFHEMYDEAKKYIYANIQGERRQLVIQNYLNKLPEVFHFTPRQQEPER